MQPPSWRPGDPRPQQPQQPQQSQPNPFAGQQQAAPQPQPIAMPQSVAAPSLAPPAAVAAATSRPHVHTQTVVLQSPWPQEMILGDMNLYTTSGRIVLAVRLAVCLPFVLAYLVLTTSFIVGSFAQFFARLSAR